jgi:uncharacterized protein (TIGR02611 family)
MKTVVAAVLGGFLLVAGIVLLILPGPGFVLIAAGLAILATRFDWAKRPLAYAKDKAEQGVREVARSPWRAVLAAVCALGLIALGVVGLAGVDLPVLNTLSAVLLIVSGVFLIGTIGYARMKHRDEVAIG